MGEVAIMGDEFVVKSKDGNVFFIDFETTGLIHREHHVSLTDIHNGKFVVTCIGKKPGQSFLPQKIEEKDVKNSKGERIFFKQANLRKNEAISETNTGEIEKVYERVA